MNVPNHYVASISAHNEQATLSPASKLTVTAQKANNVINDDVLYKPVDSRNKNNKTLTCSIENAASISSEELANLKISVEEFADLKKCILEFEKYGYVEMQNGTKPIKLCSKEEINLAYAENRIGVFDSKGKKHKIGDLPEELQKSLVVAIERYIMQLPAKKQEENDSEEDSESQPNDKAVSRREKLPIKISQGIRHEDLEENGVKKDDSDTFAHQQWMNEQSATQERDRIKKAKRIDAEVHQNHVELDKKEEKQTIQKKEEKQKVSLKEGIAATEQAFKGRGSEEVPRQNLSSHNFNVLFIKKY